MQILKAMWAWLRRWTGDDAYERYVAHVRAAHPDRTPPDRGEFFRERESEKWSGVKRCC